MKSLRRRARGLLLERGLRPQVPVHEKSPGLGSLEGDVPGGGIGGAANAVIYCDAQAKHAGKTQGRVSKAAFNEIKIEGGHDKSREQKRINGSQGGIAIAEIAIY